MVSSSTEYRSTNVFYAHAIATIPEIDKPVLPECVIEVAVRLPTMFERNIDPLLDPAITATSMVSWAASSVNTSNVTTRGDVLVEVDAMDAVPIAAVTRQV